MICQEIRLPMNSCSLQHSSGIILPSPQTAPLDPTWDDGSKNVVEPANTQKFKWLFFVADIIIPIFVTSPPDSFMPTILGCFAHSMATSGGRSTLKY